jgi:hypothetical protein
LALPAYSSGCKAVPWAGNSNNGITGQVLDANPFGPPYCDFTTGKLANLTLSGGTYLFSKSFTLTSAPVTATAPVTLIMLPGTNLNGGSSGTPGFGNNASIQITAPSSGDYAGIAIWDDSGTASNPDTMTFNGGSSTVINGAIYAPHTIIEDGGNSGVATVNGSITAWAIQVGGSGGLSVKNSSSGNLVK